MMPRSKCTDVIEHRITFGNREREVIDGLIEDITIQRYMSSAGALLNPFSEVLGYALIGGGVAYGLNTLQDGGINQTINQLFPEGGKRFLQDNFVTNTITEFVEMAEGILFPNRD